MNLFYSISENLDRYNYLVKKQYEDFIKIKFNDKKDNDEIYRMNFIDDKLFEIYRNNKLVYRDKEVKMAVPINEKFSNDGGGNSDGEFLGWIYARLNQVFGERPTLDFMQRFERIIDKMKDEQWTEKELNKLKNRQAQTNKIEEKKMTKEEAIKNCCHGIAYPEAFVQALEALGLIKFDPPKPKYISFPYFQVGHYAAKVNEHDAIVAMKNNGYTVSKNGEIL